LASLTALLMNAAALAVTVAAAASALTLSNPSFASRAGALPTSSANFSTCAVVIAFSFVDEWVWSIDME